MTYTIGTGQLLFFAALVIWDLIWRGIALWKSSQRGDKVWFIVLLIFNTAAILPIYYLMMRDLSSSPDHRQHADTTQPKSAT